MSRVWENESAPASEHTRRGGRSDKEIDMEQPTKPTRNPEWFIGGPWHGQDKLTHPSVSDVQHHAIVVPTSTGLGASRAKVAYEMRRFAIGRTTLTLWVSPDVGDLEAGTLLAEILLAPHKVAESERMSA